MGQYFNQQPVINLGSGTTFGNGYTDRNVNLGTFPMYAQPPRMVPNPEYKTNPYGLEDDQALEKWGKSKKIVGKDAPEGLMRNLAGIADFLTFGVGDIDRRGNLFGGEHLPGLRGGSGYGGQGELGNVPQTMPAPQMPAPQMTQEPNVMTTGGPVPTNQGMYGHLAQAGGIGALNHFAGRFMNNQYLNDAYNMALKSRQASDAQSVLTSQAMQRTDKGVSERMEEEQKRRNLALQGKYLTRLGLESMKKGTALTNVAYEPRANASHSSGHVGNWGVQRMG